MRISHPSQLRSLRVFCLAGRHLSFKAAADRLFLTPSAVSHQIRKLEDDLGVALFERRTRALALTPSGRQLLDELEPLLASVDAALMRAASASSRRTLRVSVPPFFASELFVPRLASLYALQPDLDIQLSTSDAVHEHTPGADVSVLLSEAAPMDLRAYELLALRLVASCSRGLAHVLRDRLPGSLASHSLIVHRARREVWNQWARACDFEAPPPKGVIEVDSWMAVVRAAERGLGVALVPASLCRARFDRGALVRITPHEVPTADTYYLVHRQEDARRPEVRALVSWALAVLR